jgi:hypothetical protein
MSSTLSGNSLATEDITVSGDITLADNSKAIFGAGSDLQIYHDGSNSYIKDSGTGALILDTNYLAMRNSAGNESMILSQENGSISLFYDASQKLATTSTGIDVTGTATMDGLTVDGRETINKNYIFGTSNYHIKLGEDSADSYIGNVNGSAFLATGNYYGSNQYTLTGGGTALSGIYADGGSGVSVFAESGLTANSTNTRKQRMLVGTNGDISFYEDTGTTAKFFWDASAERLTIGDQDGTGNLRIGAVSGAGNSAVIGMAARNSSNGISPKVTLNTVYDSAGGVNGSAFYITTRDGTGENERMRIDSSGNLLVGTTSTSIASDTSGTGFLVEPASAPLQVKRETESAGQSVVVFNNTGVDGQIIDLRKDGTTVGSIGTYLGWGQTIYMGNGDTGIAFQSTDNNTISPHNPSTNAPLDASVSLGESDYRFKDLYLSGGVYLGGTGSANHLDDYEEGTWTPTIAGSTTAGSYSHNLRTGRYTKIGNMVYAHCTIVDVVISSAGSGNFTITGLPFTCKYDQYRNIAAFRLRQANYTRNNLYIAIGENSSTAYPSYDNNGGNSANLPISDLANGTDFGFTLVYEVA